MICGCRLPAGLDMPNRSRSKAPIGRARGIARAVVGTPPILSLAALEVGIDIALEAPMAAVRAKSLRLAELFMRSDGARSRISAC